MKLHYSLLLLAAAGSLLQGCAHSQVERDLDSKVAQETDVKNRADLSLETQQQIGLASGLTTEQRSRLMALREATSNQMNNLTKESLRLRSILVKDLIASDYNEAEVNLIKKRIRKLEETRVSAIFDAVEQANQILGREALKNQRLLDDFFVGPRGHED